MSQEEKPNIQEIMKRVKADAKTPPETYLQIKVGGYYGITMVMKHPHAMQIIQALNGAEVFEDKHYDKAPILQQITQENLEFSFMSAKEYETIRAAVLMNMPLNKVKELMKPPE